MRLTKNFHLCEFACNDGVPVPEELIPNVQMLADNLQVLRDFVGVPISINSAYRHKEYNRSVGGSSRSQHLYAKASDIVVKGMPSNLVYELIEELIKDGKMKQGGLGSYDSFTHYDVRKTKARW